MNEWIRVFAPASVANVGPGFDVLGFAVSRPGDVVEVRKRTTPGVLIKDIHYIRKQDVGKLPVSPQKNTAGVAAQNVLDILRQRGIIDDQTGVEVRLRYAYLIRQRPRQQRRQRGRRGVGGQSAFRRGAAQTRPGLDSRLREGGGDAERLSCG